MFSAHACCCCIWYKSSLFSRIVRRKPLALSPWHLQKWSQSVAVLCRFQRRISRYLTEVVAYNNYRVMFVFVINAELLDCLHYFISRSRPSFIWTLTSWMKRAPTCLRLFAVLVSLNLWTWVLQQRVMLHLQPTACRDRLLSPHHLLRALLTPHSRPCLMALVFLPSSQPLQPVTLTSRDHHWKKALCLLLATAVQNWTTRMIQCSQMELLMVKRWLGGRAASEVQWTKLVHQTWVTILSHILPQMFQKTLSCLNVSSIVCLCLARIITVIVTL